MNDVLYFAYGSNLLRERLAARCKDASFQGVATLADHRLIFDKPSRKDGSGKCGYVDCSGCHVWGVLWAMPESMLFSLDRWEGAGFGYERTTLALTLPSGKLVQAVAYHQTARQEGLPPFDWYRALVLAGALQHGATDKYLETIRSEPILVDSEFRRPDRLDAMGYLRAAGYEGLTDG